MRCKICGCPSGEICKPCSVKLTAAKNSFKVLNTCQTCGNGIKVGHRGSTDHACDLSDDWIVPSNGSCNQHTNLEEPMKIYMIKDRKFNTIRGLWTDPDKLIEWVSTQVYTWTERTGETDLDVFMGENQLSIHEDGEPGGGKWIEWSELFPTE